MIVKCIRCKEPFEVKGSMRRFCGCTTRPRKPEIPRGNHGPFNTYINNERKRYLNPIYQICKNHDSGFHDKRSQKHFIQRMYDEF